MIDALVGILILTTAAVGFSYAFQTVTKVFQFQTERVRTLVEEADGSLLAPNL